jgi:hypothetical protein
LYKLWANKVSAAVGQHCKCLTQILADERHLQNYQNANLNVSEKNFGTLNYVVLSHNVNHIAKYIFFSCCVSVDFNIILHSFACPCRRPRQANNFAGCNRSNIVDVHAAVEQQHRTIGGTRADRQSGRQVSEPERKMGQIPSYYDQGCQNVNIKVKKTTCVEPCMVCEWDMI